MSKEIELTEIEKELIIAKRLEDKANGRLRQNAYDAGVVDATKNAQLRFDRKLNSNKELGENYKKFFKQLSKINPNYELVETKYPIIENISVNKIEYIDEEGNRIWKDENGELIPISKTNENLKPIKGEGINYRINYIGSEVTKGSEFYIKVVSKDVGGRFNTEMVYYMQYHGPNVDWVDSHRNYKLVKTVNTRLLEHVNSEIAETNRKKEAMDLFDLALNKATQKYINSRVEVINTYSRIGGEGKAVKVILANNIEIQLNAYRCEENGVRFTVKEINNFNEVSVDAFIGALAKAEPKKK